MQVSNEPVAIGGLITTAVTSTLAILLYVGVDPQLVAAITLASTGWIAAIAAVVRSKVTPTSKVALTTSDVELINAAKV
jgi:succinylarginine dihydrolase